MSEPQAKETWSKKEVEVSKPAPIDLLSLKLEILAKLEKWYHYTFINKGLDMNTFNHINKSVEALKESITDSFKEK